MFANDREEIQLINRRQQLIRSGMDLEFIAENTISKTVENNHGILKEDHKDRCNSSHDHCAGSVNSISKKDMNMENKSSGVNDCSNE